LAQAVATAKLKAAAGEGVDQMAATLIRNGTATLQVRRVKQSTLSTHPIFRRFVSSAAEMARLANKPLRSLISDVLRRDFSCAVTRALQL
jgi:hypothetical protein